MSDNSNQPSSVPAKTVAAIVIAAATATAAYVGQKAIAPSVATTAQAYDADAAMPAPDAFDAAVIKQVMMTADTYGSER